MSTMVQLVEELRQQLDTIVDTEQTLVASLRDALDRFDQKLLQDVRNITVEHETRRGTILSELQTLASRIGAFQVPREARLGSNGTAPEGRSALPPNGRPRALEAATWREVTSRLDSELEDYFEKRRRSA
jgi:hypothetical protein